MSKQNLKPIAAAVGTAFIASLATASVAFADDANPFATGALEDGQELLLAHGDEAMCGEAKCGEDTDDDSGDDDGEGASDDGGEGKCGAA